MAAACYQSHTETMSEPSDSLHVALESFYDNSYDIINQTNLILEYVDALFDATEDEKTFIKAEAYAARAYTHYLLTLLYSQNYSQQIIVNNITVTK